MKTVRSRPRLVPRPWRPAEWAVALKVVGGLAALMTLVACASSPPMRYFALQAIAPPPAAGGAASAYGGPALQVRSVQVPMALDRPELVREVAPGELALRELDHWAAPLPRMARQVLAENLAARLPSDRVAFAGRPWPLPGAYLTVDVLSFGMGDGVASMRLAWSISSAKASSDRPQQAGQLTLQTPAGTGAGATAEAWSRLLAQASQQIADALP